MSARFELWASGQRGSSTSGGDPATRVRRLIQSWKPRVSASERAVALLRAADSLLQYGDVAHRAHDSCKNVLFGRPRTAA